MGRLKKKHSHPNVVQDRMTCTPHNRMRDLLHLNNNPTLYRKLKDRMYKIADKHMTTDKQPSSQTEEMAAIEAELISTLPDIFDTEDAKEKKLIDVASQIITRYNYRRRSISKQKIQSTAVSSKKHGYVMSVTVPTRDALKKERKKVKKQKENDTIDITLDNDKKDEKPKDKVEFVEPEHPLMMDISNRLSGPSNTIKGPSRSTSLLKLNSFHITRPSTTAAPIKSQSAPIHAESSSQARSSINNPSFTQRNNNEDAFELTGVTRVARFLNACSPPMSHFLQPFIDFGCTSEEFLVAISTWPTDKISHFLKQVVGRGNDKHQFSQMEMLILQNHFLSYFDKAQT